MCRRLWCRDTGVREETGGESVNGRLELYTVLCSHWPDTRNGDAQMLRYGRSLDRASYLLQLS